MTQLPDAAQTQSRHGGQILVDQLRLHGVDRVFSVPGESFLAALDGFHDSDIQNIVCRHEGGAAMMAEADGKLTGRPGVLFVTRGPGATNASSGLHVAMQDSTPLVAFIGQVPRGQRDREAFQEVDFTAFFGPLVKWVGEVRETARLPEYIARAFAIAQSGRPGPVVLSLPEDMLSAISNVSDRTPGAPTRARVAPQAVSELRDALGTAQRPLVLVGGSHWSTAAAEALKSWVEASDLPVAVPFRRQDRLDNDSPCYVGDLGVGMNPALGTLVREADCLLVLGARLGEIMTGGYALIDPADPSQRILHVHPDPDLPNRIYPSEVAITARADDMVFQLAQKPTTGPWGAWRDRARKAYENWQVPLETPGDAKLEEIIGWMAANLPSETIVTNGAGNYAAWLHRYYRFRRYGTQIAPTSGSMGYGLPAAIAASLRALDRPVVCLAGDGCLQMTVNELSTAAQYGAAPVIVVVNNGRYGTIRMHQEKHYPGRVSGTDLFVPDLPTLAQAYGGQGWRVTRTEEFPDAWSAARATRRLALIEVVTDPRAISSGLVLADGAGLATA